jgi:hypothetical protein
MNLRLHGRLAVDSDEPPVELPQIQIIGGADEINALANFLHGVASDMRDGCHQTYTWRYDIPDIIVVDAAQVGELS